MRVNKCVAFCISFTFATCKDPPTSKSQAPREASLQDKNDVASLPGTTISPKQLDDYFSKKYASTNQSEIIKAQLVAKGHELMNLLLRYKEDYLECAKSQSTPEAPVMDLKAIDNLLVLGPEALAIGFSEYDEKKFLQSMSAKTPAVKETPSSEGGVSGAEGSSMASSSNGGGATSGGGGSKSSPISPGFAGIGMIGTGVVGFATSTRGLLSEKSTYGKGLSALGMLAGLAIMGVGAYVVHEGFQLAELKCSASTKLIADLKKFSQEAKAVLNKYQSP